METWQENGQTVTELWADDGWQILATCDEVWARHRDTHGEDWLQVELYVTGDGTAYEEPADSRVPEWGVADIRELSDDDGELSQERIGTLVLAGRLRVAHAIHGLPGASPLGALLC